MKVASPDERKVMLDVVGCWGVASLTGFLDITVGRYKSMAPLFIHFIGKPVEDR